MEINLDWGAPDDMILNLNFNMGYSKLCIVTSVWAIAE